MLRSISVSLFIFFFNDTATTEIYTLSLHDALPISFLWLKSRADTETPAVPLAAEGGTRRDQDLGLTAGIQHEPDRKSTRLNSSHANISYAVFCLKKKKTLQITTKVYQDYIDMNHI